MDEFSLYVLDIVMNSVRAGADKIDVTLDDRDGILTFTVADNGCGMTEEQLTRLTDPFFTTRKTRGVGLGVPFLKMLAEQTGGTVTVTSKTAEEFPEDHGTVLIATEQTAGKGRRGHSFFSPPDTGLYLSLLLRPALEAREALSLTTCAAAAVALAIEECAGTEAEIKWVNDVFCRGKKVCGILTEAALDLESGGLQYAIVGIGVNLFPPAGGYPPELAEIMGAVFEARPQGLEARSLLAGRILDRFFTFYREIAAKPFFDDYKKRSFLLGREIEVLEGGQVRPATALDLDPDFSLRVREADGRVRSLSSGEVRVKAKKG